MNALSAGHQQPATARALFREVGVLGERSLRAARLLVIFAARRPALENSAHRRMSAARRPHQDIQFDPRCEHGAVRRDWTADIVGRRGSRGGGIAAIGQPHAASRRGTAAGAAREARARRAALHGPAGQRACAA